VGRALAARLREHAPGTVFLDGDELRAAFAHDLGTGRDDRLRAAWRYVRLARLLSEQRLHVVVATVSLFAEIHRWNRAHLRSYLEVHLRAPRSLRRERDRRDSSRRRDLVARDAAYDEPASPHLAIDDDGTVSPDAIAERIQAHWLRRTAAPELRDG
jgi:adenylylsulfate kinase